jgi:hypothetical protein
MTQLSPKGLRAVEEIAHRTGFTQDAVTSMLFSLMAGRGAWRNLAIPNSEVLANGWPAARS